MAADVKAKRTLDTERTFEDHLVQFRFNSNGKPFSRKFLGGVYTTGQYLTLPLTRVVECFTYVFIRPFLPGRYGQSKSKPGEVCHRSLLTAELLVCVPLAIPLGTFGILCRSVAVGLGKEDFTFVRPPSEKDIQIPQVNKRRALKIRTHNMGCLPHISPANGLVLPRKRVKALLRNLLQGNDDIICLQEVFDVDVCNYLIRKLQNPPQSSSVRENKGYNWILADCDPKPYRLNSGLLIASRYPLENPQFVRYPKRIYEDVLAGKGVLGCTAILGQNSKGQKYKLSIFTTHSQHGSTKRAEAVRYHQFELALAFIEEYNKKYLTEDDIIVGSVFMGDFNLSPISARIDKRTGRIEARSEWKNVNQLCAGNGWVNCFYEKTKEGKIRSANRKKLLKIQKSFYRQGNALYKKYLSELRNDKNVKKKQKNVEDEHDRISG